MRARAGAVGATATDAIPAATAPTVFPAARHAVPGAPARAVTLVLAYGQTAHRSDCYTLRVRGVYKVIAPDLPEDEIAAFLRARKPDYICGACLRDAKRLIQSKDSSQQPVSQTSGGGEAGQPS